MERFEFDFALPLSLPLRFLGVRPGTAHVDVGDEHLEVWFGPWRLVTALSNVEDVTVTGPYNPLKAYGVRLSLADLGVTFGTTTSQGLCLRFREPVGAALPGGLLRHPSATVTVAEPERLARLLRRRAGDPRPLLQAVEADDVPAVPVLEPEEDRRSRERAVRQARKAARTRAEHRAAERAEAEKAARKRSAAARRAAATRAERRADEDGPGRPSGRTPAGRAAAKRTPAGRSATKRTATSS